MFRSFAPVARRAATWNKVPRSSMTAVATRTYRGDTGEAIQTLSAHEEALVKIAKPRADAIFQKHTALPGSGDDNHDVAARQKRLIYRAKQRGWLEVDLLLGMFINHSFKDLKSCVACI
jgi:hypothetical protein